MAPEFKNQLSRWPAILVVFATACFAQADRKAPCGDPKGAALKHASQATHSAAPSDWEAHGLHCAGQGYLLLAREAFDGGRLADVLRYASAAIRLSDSEPANAQLLLGALRLQGATYVERGMLSEALAVVERLKAFPEGDPGQGAAIRSLAGACYQAAGDHSAAEREYLQAIQQWDSLHRIEDAVSVRSNLGVLYLAAGRLDDAVAVLKRAHSLLAHSNMNAAFYRLVVTNNLAVAYSGRGDTTQAVLHARAALRLAESSNVGRYQLTASVYSNGAEVLRSAGHRKEAKEWVRRALRAEAMASTLVDFSDLGGGRTRP